MGSRFAARIAGYSPKTIPTAIEIRYARSESWKFGGGGGLSGSEEVAPAQRDSTIAFARWVLWEYDAYNSPPAAYLPAVRRWNIPLSALLAAALLLPIGWIALRLRRAWLRRYRPHLCAVCGYDLRGAAGDACPECGAPAPV